MPSKEILPNATVADPQIAAIAAELVKSVRADQTVDWADRESSEAAIRRKIKRLLPGTLRHQMRLCR